MNSTKIIGNQDDPRFSYRLGPDVEIEFNDIELMERHDYFGRKTLIYTYDNKKFYSYQSENEIYKIGKASKPKPVYDFPCIQKDNMGRISLGIHEVNPTTIVKLNESKQNPYKTRIITTSKHVYYLSKKTIDEIMQMPGISKNVKVYDDKLCRHISYEEWKSPIKTTKPMEYIVGGKLSQQGTMSGAHYCLAAEYISALTPYSGRYGYKTEITSTNGYWSLFVPLTIDEIMKLEGINPDVQIFIPSTSNKKEQYISYEEWKTKIEYLEMTFDELEI